MKRMCMLIVATLLLFLTSCQQSEEINPQNDLTKQGNGITFKKAGDSRNPSEFMSAEQIKAVQEAFEQLGDRKLKNPVMHNVLTRGEVFDNIETVQMQERGIKMAIINGSELFIDVIMVYTRATKVFTTQVYYRYGGVKRTIAYESKDNKEVYIIGTDDDGKMMLYDRGCNFTIPLEGGSPYTKARITFPIQMAWDYRLMNEEETCEIILYADTIKITYLI